MNSDITPRTVEIVPETNASKTPAILCCFILAAGWVVWDISRIEILMDYLRIPFLSHYFLNIMLVLEIVTFPILVTLLLIGKRSGWIGTVGVVIFCIFYQIVNSLVFHTYSGYATFETYIPPIIQVIFSLLIVSILFRADVKAYYKISKLVQRESVVYSVVLFIIFFGLYEWFLKKAL